MQDMLERALQYAERVHDSSYLTHPVEVMKNLRDIGQVADERLLSAAYLHDTLEWGHGDLTEIQDLFGEHVADWVAELTRTEPKDPQKYSRKELSKVRHRLLMADIERMSDEAKQVKLADRLANLRERIEFEQPEKLKKYVAKTKDLLERIDRQVNLALWDAVAKLVEKHS